MNSVPATFMRSVARSVRCNNLDAVSGRFGKISASKYKNNFGVYMEIVYRHPADIIEYRILRTQNDDLNDCVPYEFAPGDYWLVHSFNVWIFSEKPETWQESPWTAAKLTDWAFRNWLRSPFDFVVLEIHEDEEYDCSKILELLPAYFNVVNAQCMYSEALNRIIHKSNEEKRLEHLQCAQFFKNHSVKEIFCFVMNSERLKFSGIESDRPITFFAENTLFELWINEPEIFIRNLTYELQGGFDLPASISRFSFERSSYCDCYWLEQDHGYSKPVEATCCHFTLDHPTASGKQVLLTLISESPGFENVTNVIDARNYQLDSVFLEFQH